MGSSCVALNSGFITSHSVQNTHGYHVAATSSPPSTLLPFDHARTKSQKLLSLPADVHVAVTPIYFLFLSWTHTIIWCCGWLSTKSSYSTTFAGGSRELLVSECVPLLFL